MAAKKKLPIAKSIMSDMPIPARPMSKEQKEQERRWKAEDALRTCQKYEEIKGDKSLMSDVKRLASEQMKDLAKVAKKY